MGEADHPVFALDHARGDCRLERVRRDPRPLEQRLRGRAQRGGECERLAGRRREPGEPRAHELLEGLGTGAAASGSTSVRGAGQLQREERVPARPLVDPEQRLAREGLRADHAEADGARRRSSGPTTAVDGSCGERALQLADCAPPSASRRASRRTHLAASSRRSANASAADEDGVEPLDVVDGDQSGLAVAEKLERVAHGEAKRRGSTGRPHRPRAATRPRARAAAAAAATATRRRGRLRADLRARRARGRARPRPDARRGRAVRATRVLDAREPERRLPDPGLALEHERQGASLLVFVNEGVEGGEFGLTANDVRNSRACGQGYDMTTLRCISRRRRCSRHSWIVAPALR